MKKFLSIVLAMIMLVSTFVVAPTNALANTLIYSESTNFDTWDIDWFEFSLPSKKKIRIVISSGQRIDVRLVNSSYDTIKSWSGIRSIDREITLYSGDYEFEVESSNSGDDSYPLSIKVYTVSSTTVNVTSMSYKYKTVHFNVGDSKNLSYTTKPSGGSRSTITWSSSNTKVATVSKGKVTAKKLGKATIKAKLKNGKTYSCTAIVNKAKKTTVIKKRSKSFSSYVSHISGYKKAKWSTSNKKIATVTSSGKVTGKSSGSCNIYCTINGTKYTIPVSVKPLVSATPAGIDDVAIYNDAYVKFTNNSNKKITYITLNIKQYNNRGSRLSSPYDYYYVNETIAAHSSETYYFWVNDNTKKIKVSITKVWFSDGTTWTP